MNDKEWLQKVTTAYKAYDEKNQDVEKFISWLYRQYGIVEPKKDKE